MSSTVPPPELVEQHGEQLLVDTQNIAFLLEHEAYDQDVRAYLDQYDTDAVQLVVHPGYCSVFDDYLSLDRRTPDEYAVYRDVLSTDLRQHHTHLPTIVLYDADRHDLARSFLYDDLNQYAYVPTEERSASHTVDTAHAFAALLHDRPQVDVYVAGEVNGRCYSYTAALLTLLDDVVDTDIRVVETHTFPSRRVRRFGDRTFLDPVTPAPDTQTAIETFNTLQHTVSASMDGQDRGF